MNTQTITQNRLGQYLLLSPMGQGGMGTVYRALHTTMQRHVALKMLSTHRLDDASTVNRFKREIAVIAQLQDPHIVQAYDAGEHEGTYYLVMELIEGFDAERLARLCGFLDVASACEIVRQSALGLQAAHDCELVHRDVKPSNLLIDRKGVVKLADLGLARLFGSTGSNDLTGSNCIVGTIDYISPEQAFQGKSVDHRSDIYSLGCTLYRLLAGRAPFQVPELDTPLKKLAAHAQSTPTPLSTLRDDVPVEILRLLDRMLAKQPEDRIATASEVAETLLAYGSVAALRATAERAESIVGSQAAPVRLVESAATISTGVEIPTTKNSTFVNPRPPQQRSIRSRSKVLVAVAFVGAIAVLGLAMRALRPWSTAEPGPSQLLVSHSDTGNSSTSAGRAAPDPRPRSDGSTGTGDLPATTAELPHSLATGTELALVPKPIASAVPSIFERMPRDKIARLTWHTLLNIEPERLAWTRDDGLSTVHYDGGVKQVTVNTTALALLSLGRADVPGYSIQVELYQPRWTGGIGLFFGFQSRDEGGELQNRQYQKIALVSPGGEAEKRTFRLDRMLVVESKRRDERSWRSRMLRASSAAIEPRFDGPQVIELKISNQRLTSARWGGVILSGIADATANKDFVDSDFLGEFGLYVLSGQGTFRNARILFAD